MDDIAFWDEHASEAGVFNVPDRYYAEYTDRQATFIVNALDVYEGIVLDLGCGVGRLLHQVQLHRPRLMLVGVDSSPQMINVARQATHSELIVADSLEGLPLLDGAWSVLMFQHIDDETVAAYLADLAELLRPDARLVAQWVIDGDEAPMAYPRLIERILELHEIAGLNVIEAIDDSQVTGYADGWLWTVAEQPL